MSIARAVAYERMQEKEKFILTVGIAAVAALALATPFFMPRMHVPQAGSTPSLSPLSELPAGLVYSFNAPGVLQEAGTMAESTSPYWWLNSGGEWIIANGIGETMQSAAPLLNRWRLLYALNNPVDTDNGTHPQNLFRLVSKSTWTNVTADAHFYITADNLSTSPNRNQSNGLLLMSHYAIDGQTLYYAGIRVDGTAVIKKKYHGTYYTMAQTQVFPGTYSIAAKAGASQNLLPHQTWIGLRSTTMTNADGSVTVTLFMQQANGSWTTLLSATDKGDASVGNTPPIVSGYAGIRTDFMDVEFSNVRLQ